MRLRRVLRAAFLALAVVPALLASPASSQRSGRVVGSIADAITRRPLIGVEVRISGSDRTTATGEDGSYLIDSVPPGLVRVTAQIIGYHAITTPYYTLLPDSVIDVHFKLAPVTVQLEPVEVTADAPPPSTSNLSTTIITSEQLPRSGDLMQSLGAVVAGLEVYGRHDRARTSIRGSSTDVLYVVNGTVITPPLTFYIDNSEVECVEVRRGYTAANEYKPSLAGQTYSGLVLIWTRGSLGPKPRGCTPGR